MDSKKYLRYGAGWVGVIVGVFTYSLLADVFGVVQMAAGVITMGIVVVMVVIGAVILFGSMQARF